MLSLNRRVLVAAAAFVGAALLAPAGALAQDAAVDTNDLYAPGPLGERALGPADAPVTVVEYASMSCPHCAAFHETVFQPLKEKYIDTNKVRFIFREFPHNNPGYPPAMVARCAPEGRFFEVVDAYFDRQDEWLNSPDIMQAIRDIAKEHGFTDQTFDACVSNQALFEALKEGRDRGAAFGVTGTPTFFINGQKFEDVPSLENMESAIEAQL
jgi:protein-disulfide isomerase